MTALVVPRHVAFTQPDGKPTRAFLDILDALVVRVGGAVSISITELAISDDEDSGMEEFRHETNKALDSLAMLPPQVAQHIEQLQTELNGLREQVAVLTRELNDIQQGPIYGGNS